MLSKRSVQQGNRRVHWTKPSEDVLKLNYDASFLLESRAVSWGFLVRDSDGDVVQTGRGKVNYLSAFQAELMACLQGLQMAVDLGIGCVIVETDAQEVVAAIKTNSYDGAAVGHLVDEIKALLSLNLLSFEFVFVGRDCSRAAHELAVLGHLYTEGEGIFSTSMPGNVSVIIANNLLANE